MLHWAETKCVICCFPSASLISLRDTFRGGALFELRSSCLEMMMSFLRHGAGTMSSLFCATQLAAAKSASAGDLRGSRRAHGRDDPLDVGCPSLLVCGYGHTERILWTHGIATYLSWGGLFFLRLAALDPPDLGSLYLDGEWGGQHRVHSGFLLRGGQSPSRNRSAEMGGGRALVLVASHVREHVLHWITTRAVMAVEATLDFGYPEP